MHTMQSHQLDSDGNSVSSLFILDTSVHSDSWFGLEPGPQKQEPWNPISETEFEELEFWISSIEALISLALP